MKKMHVATPPLRTLKPRPNQSRGVDCGKGFMWAGLQGSLHFEAAGQHTSGVRDTEAIAIHCQGWGQGARRSPPPQRWGTPSGRCPPPFGWVDGFQRSGCPGRQGPPQGRSPWPGSPAAAPDPRRAAKHRQPGRLEGRRQPDPGRRVGGDGPAGATMGGPRPRRGLGNGQSPHPPECRREHGREALNIPGKTRPPLNPLIRV